MAYYLNLQVSIELYQYLEAISTMSRIDGKLTFTNFCCLAGKLVDITKNYKYMYFCCGAVVIVASIWLFIGNFINYRLLEREKKSAEMYKRTETEDPDQIKDEKEADGEAQATEELEDKPLKTEEPMQRETNI